MINIALDAMGGDNAPEAVIAGAALAVDLFEDVTIQLFGDESKIAGLMPEHDRISLVHAGEVITGEDDPVKAVRRKKNSSMVMAAQTVKEGKNDAIVSAGNSGALLTAGLLVIGRIKNIDRPGLMPILPTISKETPQVILMDAGANAEVKPINLHQFAVLASFYSSSVFNISNPRVGLLNNGTEPGKGNKLTKEAYELLVNEESINFVGNFEAREILSGDVDIIVSDGFTGNAVLKSLEGTAKHLGILLKDTLKNSGLKTKIGGALVAPALKEALSGLTGNEQGGAVLMGIKAPLIKAHGSSNEEALLNAIRQARTVVNTGVIPKSVAFFEGKDQ